MKFTRHEFITCLQIWLTVILLCFIIMFFVITANPMFNWDFALVQSANLTFYFTIIPAILCNGAMYYGYKNNESNS